LLPHQNNQKTKRKTTTTYQTLRRKLRHFVHDPSNSEIDILNHKKKLLIIGLSGKTRYTFPQSIQLRQDTINITIGLQKNCIDIIFKKRSQSTIKSRGSRSKNTIATIISFLDTEITVIIQNQKGSLLSKHRERKKTSDKQQRQRQKRNNFHHKKEKNEKEHTKSSETSGCYNTNIQNKRPKNSQTTKQKNSNPIIIRLDFDNPKTYHHQ